MQIITIIVMISRWYCYLFWRKIKSREYCSLLFTIAAASWLYLATTLLGNFWRKIQDKRQKEDKDRRKWNNRISFSLFFYIVRYSSGLKQRIPISLLPGLFLIILPAISGCTSCTVVLVALDVDKFSCRSIIFQKFSLSKVFLLCLIRYNKIAS